MILCAEECWVEVPGITVRDEIRRIEQKENLNCEAVATRDSADRQGVLKVGWLFTAVPNRGMGDRLLGLLK